MSPASTRDRLALYFRAAFPCVALQTSEEARALGEISAAAKATGKAIVTWSATEGAVDVTATGRKIDDTDDLQAFCAMRREQTVFVVRDCAAWPFDRDPILTRAFRDFLTAAPVGGSTVVLLDPAYKPHPTVEKLVTMMEYVLPGPADLRVIAESIAESFKRTDLAITDELVRAMSGMTTTEAENALTLSVLETDGYDVQIVYREKVAAVKRSGLLEILTPDPRGSAAMGGGGELKAWTEERIDAFDPAAKEYGLPTPKGIMLVGPPGTGKTLYTRVIATVMRRPLLKADLSSVQNSLIGESERRLRETFALADSQAPCILVLDEIDKGMAGSSGSGSGDSGVAKRLLGIALTWLQDHTTDVFVVATANDVTGLDSALLRKGRFDEIFSVDFPNQAERAEILSIHLAARKRDPKAFDVAAVAKATEGFTGSEIEAVLVAAMFSAYGDSRREVTSADIVAAARKTIPLSVTAKEQIAAMREWAAKRATPASSAQAEASGPKAVRALS